MRKTIDKPNALRASTAAGNLAILVAIVPYSVYSVCKVVLISV